MRNTSEKFAQLLSQGIDSSPSPANYLSAFWTLILALQSIISTHDGRKLEKEKVESSSRHDHKPVSICLYNSTDLSSC